MDYPPHPLRPFICLSDPRTIALTIPAGSTDKPHIHHKLNPEFQKEKRILFTAPFLSQKIRPDEKPKDKARREVTGLESPLPLPLSYSLLNVKDKDAVSLSIIFLRILITILD